MQGKLDAHWSPEQVSGWLRRGFPDNGATSVCHETIYQAVYVQSKGRLGRDIEARLRSGRASRRPRSAGDGRRPRFRDPMAMISERPVEAEDRAVPGHWEGDLITGAALGMQVYFCDPHSPWQRGTNENTNGLLRQYFPKGTDLSAYPEDYLDAVAEELNDRPRKTLGFMKPSELFLKLIDESEDAA